MQKLEDLKFLREKTGVGLMECKSVLNKFNGNLQLAIIELKKKSLELAKNLHDRPTNHGVIASYIHPGNQRGVLLELKCESDFVARHTKFINLAEYLAYHLTILDHIIFISLEKIPDKLKKSIFKENATCVFFLCTCFDNPSVTIEEHILNHIAEFKENIKISQYSKFKI